MAELDPHTDAPSSEASSQRTRRPRRKAGAPAGAPTAPVTTPEVSTAPAQPRTTVAETSVSVVADAKPLNLRAKRLAERAARAEAEAAASAPSARRGTKKSASAAPSQTAPADERENDAPTTKRAPEEDAPTEAASAPVDAEIEDDAEIDDDADGEDDAPRSSAVFADLRALADSRKDTPEPVSAEPTSMTTSDFASLLFQAPSKTTESEPEVVGGVFAEASTLVSFDAPDLEAARLERERRAAIERAQKAAADDDADEADGTDEADDASREDSDDDSEDSEDSKSSRRRRRRGGRGRRGRGRGDDDGSDDDSTEDAPQRGKDAEDSADSEADDSGKDSDGPSSDATDDDQGGSSRRRRRRRRTSGQSSDDPQPDDPPNTVVRVRQERDEVRGVKGSTRLEAKKQRRKEGRESGRRRHSVTESEFLARRESVKRSMIVRERPGRTQIVVLEDNILVEHYVAQKSQTSMAGNVYLGKVQNVLPSMEAAFVDIGKGRNAVLYAGEVNWDAAGLEGQPRRIELALKSGDPVLVQVTKDPIGHKGARLTSQISLPGRYLVYVPGGSMTGISRKLPDNERARLKKILKSIVPDEAGVIVRTAAEGASEEELTRDVERLRAQWEKIEKASKSKNAPAALSTEPDLAIKVVRDIFNEDFTSLVVEGDSVYRELHEYISGVAPDLLERVTKHVGTKDSFAKYRVDEQLMKAMDRKVYLPSGGSLVIDRTEAMTVVDVNTGKFTGAGGSLEETVTRNNLEAAEEIVRQLRLRDIGGIIVVDFIDMVLEANRDLVLRRMIECLSRDRTKHQVAEVTSLGLVQMTRKRVGAGLVETFSTTCEHCNGRGIQIDLDGHQHVEAPAFEDDSSRKSRRRNKRGSKGNDSSNGNGNGGGQGSGNAQQADADASTGGNGSSNGNSRTSSAADDKAASAKDAVQDLVDQKNSADIHRLEEDEQSRALARATIASIAAATSKDAPPEVTVDGLVISVSDEEAGQPSAPANAQGTPERELPVQGELDVETSVTTDGEDR
ncbi:MAG: Rne/Rng family ribonuclease [Dermabacter sp.]|nr:Rne/Rng family ribonuclease [Dermabacter sp.]